MPGRDVFESVDIWQTLDRLEALTAKAIHPASKGELPVQVFAALEAARHQVAIAAVLYDRHTGRKPPPQIKEPEPATEPPRPQPGYPLDRMERDFAKARQAGLERLERPRRRGPLDKPILRPEPRE